ncbi:MAG: Asp-tRNA(Asn)/Glu-tRNA(Gln) amidotransferase GatCAB subunit A, partial [Candidatus Latescibacteria bacterium]|nr:Asp-tRNA(Asn)/Glu-tRNA(Gln) amidotransferase GatCAB subunit A [Candidatus Latescibacterota bacterium]
MPPLYFQTITEVAELIREKKISPVEVTQELLARIEELDGRFKSYTTVMVDEAMEAAKAAEAEIALGKYRGALHGIPVAVKDL